MTTIAPNGVTISDYDPIGIGSVVFGCILRADRNTHVNFGEIVDTSVDPIRPCGIIDFAPDPKNNVKSSEDGGAMSLPGKWRCLGYLHLGHSDVAEAATLFMRVE